MDFRLKPGSSVQMEKEEWKVRAGQLGLRVGAVSLDDFVSGRTEPMDLVRGVDAFRHWVDSGKERMNFSPEVFNRAAANGNAGVILGLEGTSRLGSDPVLFRSLARLGLGMLVLKERGDPVFESGRISGFGESVLQTCRKEGVFLLLEVEGDSLVERIVEMAGPVMILWPGVEERENLDPGLFQLKGGLWVVECGPETRAQALSDFMDLAGPEKCHFLVLPVTGDSEETLRGAHLERIYSLMQEFYMLRREKQGEEKAYREMAQVLGGNLKGLFR